MPYLKAFLIFSSLFLFSACSGVFFYPDKKLYNTPKDFNLSYETHTIETKEGIALDAWHIKPHQKSKGLIVVAHGNAQNMSAHFRGWEWIIRTGYELFIFDYRGYGNSNGETSIQGSVFDLHLALDYVERKLNRDYFLCGQSLGGSLAIAALSQKKRERLQALIIDATFTSFSGIVSEKMGQLFLTWPFKWLPYMTLPDDYDAIDHINGLGKPLLFIHGSKDQAIPANHSWQLFDRASRPKELWIVTPAGHINSLLYPPVQKAFLEFLNSVKTGKYYHKDYAQMRIYH